MESAADIPSVIHRDIKPSHLPKLRTMHKWVQSATNDDTPPEEYSWLPKHLEGVIVPRIEQYSNLNTKKSYYTAVTAVLRHLGLWQEYLHYSALSTELNKLAVESESKNDLSNRERHTYRTLQEIMDRADDVTAAYQDLETAETPTLAQHMVYLVAQLFTLAPPMRRSPYIDARFVHDEKEATVEPGNCIFRKQNQDNNWVYAIFVKRDKVAHSVGPTIVEFNPALSAVIHKSVRQFPREYLLTLDGENPLSVSAFDNLIMSALDARIDVIRSAFVSDKFTMQRTYAEKENIAKNMRTSLNVCEVNYFKVPQNIHRRNRPPVVEDNYGNRALNRVRLLSRRRAHYHRNRRAIRARALARALNAGKIAKPRELTLQYYGLHKGADGQYTVD